VNILITGAGRGIGKAIALQFGKAGFHKFYLTYNKTNINDVLDLKEELEEMWKTLHEINEADRDTILNTAKKISSYISSQHSPST